MRIFIFIVSVLAFAQPVFSQAVLRGTVWEYHEEHAHLHVIEGANVYWQGTTDAVTTDANGFFSLARPTTPLPLVISYVGYQNDTLAVEELSDSVSVVLQPGVQLETVTVTEARASTFISTLNPIKTEVITQGELRKAACCNLSKVLKPMPLSKLRMAMR